MNNCIIPDFLLSIHCMTYNQASFVEETMLGFCMQQTNFPYIAIIIDDASTDGEQKVLEQYLHNYFETIDTEETDDYTLALAKHNDNQNCFFCVYYLKYNFYRISKSKDSFTERWGGHARYIATCEGDDYWTDPQKLQKQVDFLESHPDYVLCCHETMRYSQNTGEMSYIKHKVLDQYPEGFTFDSSYDGWNHDGWLAQTLTNVYRSDFKERDIFMSMKNRYDVIFMYFIKKAGKCFLMADVMGVYRINDSGICSGVPFTTFYMNILNAFQELNQVDRSSEARYMLQRHLRVNMGNLILLREWKTIFDSIRIVCSFTPILELTYYVVKLPFHGIRQVSRAFCDVIKNKIK